MEVEPRGDNPLVETQKQRDPDVTTSLEPDEAGVVERDAAGAEEDIASPTLARIDNSDPGVQHGLMGGRKE